FFPIQSFQLSPTQTSKSADGDVRQNFRRCVFQEPRSLFHSENANRRVDLLRFRGLLRRILNAVAPRLGEIERDNQDAPEIISGNRGEAFSGFLVAQAPQPFVNLRRGDLPDWFAVESL